jgi:hypothetical protein
VGVIGMGIAIPIMLFFLLGLHTLSQLLTIAAVTFIAWGVCDLLSTILERPRLKDRSPGRAIKEDWDARTRDDGRPPAAGAAGPGPR